MGSRQARKDPCLTRKPVLRLFNSIQWLGDQKVQARLGVLLHQDPKRLTEG